MPDGQANVAIGYGGSMPSRLELPVVPGVTAPTPLPPCPGLRGEPCRDYQSFTNRTATVGGGRDTPVIPTEPSGSGSGPQVLGKCAAGPLSKKHKKKHKGCGKRKKKGRKHKK